MKWVSVSLIRHITGYVNYSPNVIMRVWAEQLLMSCRTTGNARRTWMRDGVYCEG